MTPTRSIDTLLPGLLLAPAVLLTGGWQQAPPRFAGRGLCCQLRGIKPLRSSCLPVVLSGFGYRFHLTSQLTLRASVASTVGPTPPRSYAARLSGFGYRFHLTSQLRCAAQWLRLSV